MIAAIVLAAGAGRRFGSQKLVQLVDGEPLVRASVERVVGAGPELTIVVVGHEAAAVRRALSGLAVEIVTNPRPSDGMSSSLRAGLAVVPSSAVAVLIALGDQPIVHSSVIPGLMARFSSNDVAIVAPKYCGIQGLPVVFGRSVFGELDALTGDRGARSVIEADPARVAYVAFDHPMPPDVDTPEDLDRLTRR